MALADLKRYPYWPHDLLQAWDSADELLLDHLAAEDLTGRRILIVGDTFGALATSLADHHVASYTDSYVGAKGASLNGGGAPLAWHDLAQLAGPYDLVLIRIPKNMSYLEDVLHRLTPHLAPGAKLIGAAMVKHLAKSAFDLIGRIIGETSTSLARKKARLVFATFSRPVSESPHPKRVRLDGFATEFVHHSNLFSRERLDVGTRFFLEHVPTGDFRAILDLGCANGVVGIRAKQRNPAAKIIFTDDSAMAIASARANYAAHFADEAAFHWTNGYEDGPADSLDLVLCNPPFHEGHTVGRHIAERMFRDALRTLRRGGRLRVIGNSHLLYGSTLHRMFGNARGVAKNAKFQIWETTKTGNSTP